MNPYDIDIEGLKESKNITDKKELLKLKLTAAFLKVIATMNTDDVLTATGLDKSDLSRLKAFNVSRFTIDRIIGILDTMGLSIKVAIEPKEAS